MRLRPPGRAGRDERDRAQGRPRVPQGPRGRRDVLRGHGAGSPPRRGPARRRVSRETARRGRSAARRRAARADPASCRRTDPTASTTVRASRRRFRATSRTRCRRSRCRSWRAARRIADLGSGAGWPGLALAAALPEAHVCAGGERDPALPLPRAGGRGVRPGERARRQRARRGWPEGLLAHDLVTARALGGAPGDPRVRGAAARRGRARRVLEGRGRATRSLRRALPRRRSWALRCSSRSPVDPVRGRARPHAARVPQDRAHAGPLPAPARDGHQAAARASTFHVKRLAWWHGTRPTSSDCRTTGAGRPCAGSATRSGIRASGGSSCRRRSAGDTA